MNKSSRVFILIILLVLVCGAVALPQNYRLNFNVFGRQIDYTISGPVLNFNLFGKPIHQEFKLKQGLDIQGGMQVVLQAQMENIPAEDRAQAIESARSIIERRVDLFGVSEPVVQTSQQGDEYRLIVELAGVDNPEQALSLIGTTAELEFLLQDATPSAEATISAQAFFDQFKPTGISGKQLKRSTVQFDQQTGAPIIGLEFNDEGRQLFAEVTKNNVNSVLGIFMDGFPLMLPTISTPILDGQAVITGQFTVDEAKDLSIQLNAGALPVPIQVLEQRQIGASLGQRSVQDSLRAGLIGLGLVMLFMVLYYGIKGLLADLALVVYAVITIALYKVLGVTITLPGLAGLILSIGMAVDANILIFERMKEELRLGKSRVQALELGFGRAWDSIKDANLATIITALILINPFELQFLNTSGLVRGFGITLFIGVLVSLVTGIVVTRTLMRLFLKD